jgi:hypothetical protein
MRPDEDLPGGERVDGEGMVYSLDGGTRTVYFCDRFRRYKFDGKAGGLALLQAMCTKNDTCLGLNAKLFSADPEVHSCAAGHFAYDCLALRWWRCWCVFTQEAAQQRSEGYALYEEKPNLRRRDRKQIGTWSDEEYGLAGFQWMYDAAALCLVSLCPRSENDSLCICTATSSFCALTSQVPPPQVFSAVHGDLGTTGALCGCGSFCSSLRGRHLCPYAS